MFWATKLAGTQIFVSNIVGILLGEPRTFLLNPPKKNKAPYTQFLKVSNLHLAKKKIKPLAQASQNIMGI